MSTKDKKNSAFMKPVQLSKSLEKITGQGPMPRTEVTKRLWEYIRKHKLQAQDNKREIIPDEKLSEVLGSSKRIDMFKMTKEISKHLKSDLASSSR